MTLVPVKSVSLIEFNDCKFGLHLDLPKPDAATAHLSYRAEAWRLLSFLRTCPPRFLRLI